MKIDLGSVGDATFGIFSQLSQDAEAGDKTIGKFCPLDTISLAPLVCKHPGFTAFAAGVVPNMGFLQLMDSLKLNEQASNGTNRAVFPVLLQDQLGAINLMDVVDVQIKPKDWICSINKYNDGIICDCHCGMIDPDCLKPSPYEYAILAAVKNDTFIDGRFVIFFLTFILEPSVCCCVGEWPMQTIRL